MLVKLSKNIGLCHGCKKIMTLIEENKDAYILDFPIHNRRVFLELENKKYKTLKEDEYEKIPANSTVITSADGINKEIKNILLAKNITLIDGTCKIVERIYKILEDKNDKIIIIGNKNHDEVSNLVSYFKDAIVISNLEELDYLNKKEKYFVVAQSTTSLNNFNSIIAEMKNRDFNFEYNDTICPFVLERRKQEILDADVVFVVSDTMSSNGNELALYFKEKCSNVYMVNAKEDLADIDLTKYKNALLASATSTPIEIVNEIKEELEKHN